MANTSIMGTYSPEDVACVISNDRFSHTISGYTDGTFLTVSRVIPASTLYTGADGTNARTIRAVKNLDLTFTLHQSSESNDILSALLVLDEQARNSDELFSITIKDTIGRTLVSSPTCFIGTTPDLDFATDITDRQWVLHCVGSTVHIGGNARFSNDGYAAATDLEYTPNSNWQPQD